VKSTTAEVTPSGEVESLLGAADFAQAGAVSGRECRASEGEEAHAVRMPAHTTPTIRKVDADITDPGERKERIEVLSRSECEVAEEPLRTLAEKSSH
jgi:hypothetical protein